MQKMDFSALIYNARFFKKRLGASRLCAVVKNNAYGHGLDHVARYLENFVDCFAVGSPDEAKTISFVRKDILILLPQDEVGTVAAIKLGCILTVDSFSTLQLVRKVADKLRRRARVHIKIDSGMSRLGFGQNDIAKLLFLLQDCENVIVEGVYSHLYDENILSCDKQLSVFLPCAETIEKSLKRPLIKHIANTAGALLDKRYHLDMARIGLGLYGYGNESLVPVKSVTAQVMSVKDVVSGSVVGYGGYCKVAQNAKVAVVNIGYAQGFARSLVGTKVVVNGARCTVLAVCMAMIIVNVDGVDVRVGDTVTLLSRDVNICNDSVSVYELLCNLR